MSSILLSFLQVLVRPNTDSSTGQQKQRTASVDSAYSSCGDRSSTRSSTRSSSTLSQLSDHAADELDAVFKSKLQPKMASCDEEPGREEEPLKAPLENGEEHPEDGPVDRDPMEDEGVEAEIMQGPVDATVVKGQQASFSATFIGDPQPAVQWFKKVRGGKESLIILGLVWLLMSVSI